MQDIDANHGHYLASNFNKSVCLINKWKGNVSDDTELIQQPVITEITHFKVDQTPKEIKQNTHTHIC